MLQMLVQCSCKLQLIYYYLLQRYHAAYRVHEFICARDFLFLIIFSDFLHYFQ